MYGKVGLQDWQIVKLQDMVDRSQEDNIINIDKLVEELRRHGDNPFQNK